MLEQKQAFNVWSDGSFYQSTKRAGAGIIFSDAATGELLKTNAIPLTHMNLRNSTEAEIVAATLALRLAETFTQESGRIMKEFRYDNPSVGKIFLKDTRPRDAATDRRLAKLCAALEEEIKKNMPRHIEPADNGMPRFNDAHMAAHEGSDITNGNSLRTFNAIFATNSETSERSTDGTDGFPVPEDDQTRQGVPFQGRENPLALNGPR